MLHECLQHASGGETLWLPELRDRFEEVPGAETVILRLSYGEGQCCDRTLPLPHAYDAEERVFLLRYLAANVYNLLSAYSGSELCFFSTPESETLLRELPELFASSRGYGKVLNIARRIHGGVTVRFAPLEA